MSVHEFVIVQTTTNSSTEVQHLASAAVQQQLAACVQVAEVQSFYRWDGEVHEDPEFLLSFKTTFAAMGALQEFLAEHHSYDEPEFIVSPIIDGSQGYLQWMRDSITG